jgi:hypothetical protein
MKYNADINYQGVVKPITIETSIYQNRHLFDITVEDKYAVIYQDNGEWKQDTDEKLDDTLLNAVVEAIEKLKPKLQV